MNSLVMAGRLVFGLWFALNGLNHWCAFVPQPMGVQHVSTELIVALLDSGLFSLVKGIEVIVGVLILTNRFTPLALIAALPISIVIAYWNIILEHAPGNHIAGALTLGINALLMLAYIEYYLPMLRFRSPLGAAASTRSAL